MVQDIVITVNPAPVTNTVVTDNSNNTNSNTTNDSSEVVNLELLLQPMNLQVQLKHFQ